MQRNMDQIQFEYRYEIEEVLNALNVFIKEHPDASEKTTVGNLCDMLDIMHMEW